MSDVYGLNTFFGWLAQKGSDNRNPTSIPQIYMYFVISSSIDVQVLETGQYTVMYQCITCIVFQYMYGYSKMHINLLIYQCIAVYWSMNCFLQWIKLWNWHFTESSCKKTLVHKLIPEVIGLIFVIIYHIRTNFQGM